MSETPAATQTSPDVSPAKMRQVVAASAAGTVFEWYDFFIYASLAFVFRANFFANLPDAQATVFTLLTFAVGFIVRPFGALFFGKIGDSKGRKGAFLVTITLMGIATFAIGLLPTQRQLPEQWVLLAPTLLVLLRMLQGFALGGEYGGAAIYVAEHAPNNRRGLNTSWIQTSAGLGLIGALGVILVTRITLGEAAFMEWGWRIPFLLSIGLFAVSLWIRLSLEESPAFHKIKAEGRTSKRVFAESFFEWKNLRIVLLALVGLMMAQGVVWYTGHFHARYFLESSLKVESRLVDYLMLGATSVSVVLYVFFGWLSDKIGRRPVMLFGMVLMLASYFPGFQLMTRAANPDLAAALAATPVTVVADPAECNFQLDLTGGAGRFGSSCDIARGELSAAGISYASIDAPAGTLAQVRIGETIVVDSIEGRALDATGLRDVRAEFRQRLLAGLDRAGYPALDDNGAPAKADASEINFPVVLGTLILFVLAATALYGPQAAALVELFPTRIRYTAMSFPYHVGTGWFGGLLPTIVFAIGVATGDVYAGLWFPVIVTAMAALTFFFFWPETKGKDISAD
ncbi:MAG: MFS transporter [Hyphomonadaceae bacterium]|nr:MFS transporter [Hyphomonadaceae bacterium]